MAPTLPLIIVLNEAHRYDCERDEWNHCYDFTLNEDVGGSGYQSDSDDDDEDVWGPSYTQPQVGSFYYDDDEDGDGDEDTWGPSHTHPQVGSFHDQHPTPHHETDSQMTDALLPEQTQPRSPETDSIVVDAPPQGEDTADPPTEAPTFDSDAHLQQLISAQHRVPPHLVFDWNDGNDYLYKRYGLEDVSEELAKEPPIWSATVGMPTAIPSTSVVELFNSFVNKCWPPSICDLSPDLVQGSKFPVRSPDSAISVHSSKHGYVVTVKRDPPVDWKLLIKDPLSLLQIEREEWDSNPSSLITNLITKGVPFQILHPRNLEGALFYPHPGPTVHPTGKRPEHVDYLAYGQELADFFTHYPHAYAVALSSGGIQWRIAMDVLPEPQESDITRQFHPDVCSSLTLDGCKYWTPRLTTKEMEVVVGVYKWAICKSTP